MQLKKLLIALLLSVPLVPLLILPTGTLDDAITGRDVLLAAPFVLEFMGFYVLYLFTKNQSSFTAHEQKLLLLLAGGYFAVLGIPVLITAIVQPTAGVSTWGFVLMMAYAFTSLLVNTWKVSQSHENISKYFSRRYIWPAVASLAIVLFLILTTKTELNGIALYFIIKNFIFAFSQE